MKEFENTKFAGIAYGCSKNLATCYGFEIIIHVGPSHYYNAKLKPSSVQVCSVIYMQF
jgi:hypothetical protein